MFTKITNLSGKTLMLSLDNQPNTTLHHTQAAFVRTCASHPETIDPGAMAVTSSIVITQPITQTESRRAH